MVATESPQRPATTGGALRALTAAALALPGLIATPALAADEDGVDLQYGHYREGGRKLFGVESKYDPIEADSLKAALRLTLSDRVRLALGFSQDTWSGATQVATAPREFRGNYPSNPDGITGASPYLVYHTTMFVDSASLLPLRSDGYGVLLGGTDEQLVQTLSSASPETRKQFDATLSHEWDEAALDIGGGISRERDYRSSFLRLGGRLDFNGKLTTLAADLSYTTSRIAATLDHDALPYILDKCVECGFLSGSSTVENTTNGGTVLRGRRRDASAHIGLTQVLNRRTVIEAGIGYTRSRGYLGNPYKVVEVGFIDPDQQFFAPEGTSYVQFNALLEQRPDARDQGALDLRLARHVAWADAALHVSYRYFNDDWGIAAHTLELQWAQPLARGWTLTPRLRYYSQSTADFYHPYLITQQAERPAVVDPVRGQIYEDYDNLDSGVVYFDDPDLVDPIGFNPNSGQPVVDADGNPVSQEVADRLLPKQTLFDRGKLPERFSSDYRLAGYGSLSVGLTLGRRFDNGVSLELGVERYRHAAGLKLGGAAENGYGNFSYTMFNASLRVDVGTRPAGARRAARLLDAGAGGHALHEAADHSHAGAPAGLDVRHALGQVGALMIGYRYQFRATGGGMRHGSGRVGDDVLRAAGCDGDTCLVAPERMHMHMHMFELMYAPTSWLTLMLMPQYVDMTMHMRSLVRDSDFPVENPDRMQIASHHARHPHTSGGIGDTELHALFPLLQRSGQRLQAGLGVSLPTASVGARLRDNHHIAIGYTHYDMQRGSGTWDFKPGLTYSGERGRWSWGAMLDATVRMEGRNSSGYVLGDEFRANAWSGYRMNDWFAVSARLGYARQGRIRGAYDDTFNPVGPMDYTANYGGRYLDAGVGLELSVPHGAFAGNQLGIEWLQPVHDDVNGYQLRRRGSLGVRWSVTF